MPIKFDTKSQTPLTEGGEGFIYEHKGQIIKVFKPHIDIKAKERKVNALMKLSLPQSVICPTGTVFDRQGAFIGYAMEKVAGEEFKRLSNRKFAAANNTDTKFVLSLLVKAKSILAEIHRNGIYVGDLNDQNILFNMSGNVFFIDCDSWSVGNDKCSVAMDLFKDPTLIKDNFNEKTDIYAFSVLAWKTLTRVHPFGGTLTPDIPIIDRMKKGLSVIGRKVQLPRTTKAWNGFSPNMKETFQMIFEQGQRTLDNCMEDMLKNLSYCKKDKEYYYSKFSSCPYCNSNAEVNKKPQSQGTVGGMKLIALYDGAEIKTMFDRYTYLDNDGHIINGKQQIMYQPGNRYYFLENGGLIEDSDTKFTIYYGNGYTIEKKYKTSIEVEGNKIYYISPKNSFTEIEVLKGGNAIKNICKVSNNAYFSVSNGSYCIVNYYFGKVIVNIDGVNTVIDYDLDVQNYGIHKDGISGKWLLIFEDSKQKFNTYVLNKNEVEYHTDGIKYDCQLNCPCISNSTIFIPIDGKIRGFNYQKSAFKDFECSVVSDDSKLIKGKNRFVIVNLENVYCLG